MKLLLLTDNRFWREAMGSQVRISALVQALLAQGHELKLLFVGSPSAADLQSLADWKHRHPDFNWRCSGSLPGSQGVATTTAREGRTLRQRLAPFLRHARYLVRLAAARLTSRSPLPATAAWRHLGLALQEPSLLEFRRHDALAAVARWCAEEPPQVILVEYLRLTYLLDAVQPEMRAQLHCMVDTHDVQSERRARFHQLGKVHDLKISPLEESLALARFDTILAIQARDAATLAAMQTRARVIVTPHPVPVRPRARDTPLDEPLRLLFLGSDMAPNRQAVLRLVHEIWPGLSPTARKAARLSIAGNVCQALDAAALPEGVDLLGSVADIEALYDSHQIAVTPIDMGGGLKIKNVEALGAGLALLTTSCGAEGLEAGLAPAAPALRLAESSAEFTVVLEEWLADRGALARQRARAISFAQAHFSHRTAYRELLAHLDKL